MNDIGEGLTFYVVFLFSTTLHEAAHAWAAKLGGDLTAYHGGQVSLDPVPHIRREPFGMVILPLLTALTMGFPIGFASAPYDPEWAQRYPKRSAWMALAGPGANLLLVLLSGLAIKVGGLAGIFEPPNSITFGHIVGTVGNSGALTAVAFFLGTMFSMNLLLAAFNLLPFPPMDGSAAIPLFVGEKNGRVWQNLIWRTPALNFVGYFIAWQVFGYIFRPLFNGSLSVLYPGVTYGA
jgi:Zn-dependent protease